METISVSQSVVLILIFHTLSSPAHLASQVSRSVWRSEKSSKSSVFVVSVLRVMMLSSSSSSSPAIQSKADFSLKVWRLLLRLSVRSASARPSSTDFSLPKPSPALSSPSRSWSAREGGEEEEDSRWRGGTLSGGAGANHSLGPVLASGLASLPASQPVVEVSSSLAGRLNLAGLKIKIFHQRSEI